MEDDRKLRSCQDVVARYLAMHAANASEEMHWFGQPKSIAEAIERACASLIKRNGRRVRHDHQCLIPAEALAAAAARLRAQRDVLADAADFRRLHDLVEDAILPIPGIGELTVYDVAHRIGTRQGVAPAEVYVHRGVRKGARALGFRGRKDDCDG
jgi:hypothetical protein